MTDKQYQETLAKYNAQQARIERQALTWLQSIGRTSEQEWNEKTEIALVAEMDKKG